jgi:hypothetical protein
MTEGKDDEPLIRSLNAIIRFSVRLLAILMTLVILWAVDVYGIG